jgi:hypothetical protein
VAVDMQTKEPIEQTRESADAPKPPDATINQGSVAQIAGCDRECERIAFVTGHAAGCDRGCETAPTRSITDFVCSTINVGLGLLLSVQTCTFNYGGRFYTATTGGVGWITAATLTVAGGPASTNATQPADLGSWFTSAGGSGGRFGVSLGGDRATGTADDGRAIEVTTVEAGLGGGFPFAEIHEQLTYTWVDEFDQAAFDEIWGDSGVYP